MLVVAACSLARPTSSAAGGKPAGATGDSSAVRGWLAGVMSAGMLWRCLRGCVERGRGDRPACRGREVPGTELCLHRAREGRPGGASVRRC
jgi:hypothetical protein